MILGFRTVVTNALEDWAELFHQQLQREKDENIPASEGPSTEAGRTMMINELFTKRCVRITKWCPEEVYALIIVAYPTRYVAELTRDHKCSLFLDTIYQAWKPTFYYWAKFLWLYCGRASNLYGDILYLLPGNQKPPPNVIGKVLFSELIRDDVLPEYSLACIVSAFITDIAFSMSARVHENLIDLFGSDLTPSELGRICRSIVLCRAMRKNLECCCGYKVGEVCCICPVKDENGTLIGQSLDDFLMNDMDKEYCFVLFKLILERHDEESPVIEKRWTKSMRDDFLLSACEYVFSEQIYTEIYQNLHSGTKPTIKQKFPRELSDLEKQNNAARFMDGDYDHSIAKHAGCVVTACKQSMKADCMNMACKQHCHNFGRYKCKVHRNYHPNDDDMEPPRKNVREKTGNNEMDDRAQVFVREGDI